MATSSSGISNQLLQSLSTLNDLNVENDKKYAIVLHFIKTFGTITDQNRETILSRISNYPFIQLLDRMLVCEKWLASVSGPDIALCSVFYTEIKAQLQEQMPDIVFESSISPGTLSNNQQRREICQSYSRLTIPSSWYSAEHIKVWPLIILKCENFKRQYGRNAPTVMYNLVSKILEGTSTDVGGVIDCECGHQSLKIKCDSIASRSRLCKFLQEKLEGWSLEIPTLRNPLIRLNGIRLDTTKENEVSEWISRLISRNNWTDPAKEVKFIFALTKKQPKVVDIILSVTPNIREQIERKFGMVNAGSKMIQAMDHFDIKQCSKCSAFGHSFLKCTKMSKCGFCGINHVAKCEAETNHLKRRCPNCLKPGHSAWDKKCPIFQIKLKHELEKTNFCYKNIMH